MCRCENLTLRKAEHQTIEAFELRCQRRLLSVPWTTRRSNQSILKEMNPEYEYWKDWYCNWSSNTLATWCKRRLTGKDSDALKDWRQKKERATDNEMVVWHHQLDGHEFEQTSGDSEGQGSLVCCSPGVTESDMTEQVNNNRIRNKHTPLRTSLLRVHNPLTWKLSSWIDQGKKRKINGCGLTAEKDLNLYVV